MTTLQEAFKINLVKLIHIKEILKVKVVSLNKIIHYKKVRNKKLKMNKFKIIKLILFKHRPEDNKQG
jgi:hypothetical protein